MGNLHIWKMQFSIRTINTWACTFVCRWYQVYTRFSHTRKPLMNQAVRVILGKPENFYLQSDEAFSSQHNLLSQEAVRAMSVFFSPPCRLFHGRSRNVARDCWLSFSGIFPPSPSFSSYITSHHLHAVQLLAKLIPSMHRCFYFVYHINDLCDSSQLWRNVKHVAIPPLSKTTSPSPSAASRKYTVSCHYCTKPVWQLPAVPDKPDWRWMQSDVNEWKK